MLRLLLEDASSDEGKGGEVTSNDLSGLCSFPGRKKKNIDDQKASHLLTMVMVLSSAGSGPNLFGLGLIGLFKFPNFRAWPGPSF